MGTDPWMPASGEWFCVREGGLVWEHLGGPFPFLLQMSRSQPKQVLHISEGMMGTPSQEYRIIWMDDVPSKSKKQVALYAYPEDVIPVPSPVEELAEVTG